MKRLLPLTTGLLILTSAPVLAQPGNAPEVRPTIDVFALIERLSEDMDKEFILDPRMAGVFGHTTAGADADYETLLGLLRASSFVAVETADQIWIAPEAGARTLPSRVLQEDDPSVSDHEIVTRIIELPDIEITQVPGPSPDDQNPNPFSTSRPTLAATLVPILRPMMNQAAQLGAPLGVNKLVLVDRYDNVRRITAVIDALIEQQGGRRR